MNRKAFHPAELKLDDQGSFEAAFAQLNVVDHDGDLTMPGAFTKKDVPMSAYNHTSWDGALPVGKGTITEQGDWAIFTGKFFLNTSHGRDAYETVKSLGPLTEFSYGYSVLDSAPGVHQGRNVRVLKSLDVMEVSPVLRGAGLGTHLRAIKSGDPGADAPYAEHLSWYADGLTALLDRTRDRKDFREVEGRKLSRSDRAQLESIAAALSGHLDVIWSLLPRDEEPAEETPKSVTLEVLLATARRYGVTV